jgi:hypothetical protein
MSKSFIVIIMSLDHFGRRECCVKYHLYQMKNRRQVFTMKKLTQSRLRTLCDK